MISFIRAILYYLTVAVALCVIGVPYMLIRGGIFGQWEKCTELCILFFRVVFKLFGIKLEVIGKENIPAERNFVIVSNHQSFLDINVIWPSITICAFIAKEALWHIPVFGWVITHIGCIPVHKDPRKNADIGKRVVERLSNNYVISVFPEGHRSADGRLLKFQNGIFRMAKENHFPLLPITLVGTGERLAKTKWAFTPGVVKIVVHPLQTPESFAEKPAAQLRDEVFEMIESALPYKQAELAAANADASKEA
ncbi:MAG: 1-acyl-sn-glycerol-3-phosphate acyltransferase [Fibrobacter sp.]|nr:1-acyl-sn-glycerol-3-phosphate acyltransferase [Fibrobacter sp.]